MAGNSSYSPQTVRRPLRPDPMAAEHAPQAVKAGPFIFLSGVSATDYTKGLAVTKQPGFPIYGSDPEMQANYAFQNMGKVLEAAGSGLDQGIKSQLYEPDLLNFHQIDAVWGEYMHAAAQPFVHGYAAVAGSRNGLPLPTSCSLLLTSNTKSTRRGRAYAGIQSMCDG